MTGTTDEESTIDKIKTWFVDHPNVRYALEATGLFLALANPLSAKLLLMMLGNNPILHFFFSLAIFFGAAWTRMYFINKPNTTTLAAAST